MSEQHAETTTTRTWTEAPASANIKFRLNGFDTMLTLRADSGAELLPKLEAAMDWLAKKGAAPTASANGNGGGNGQAETKVCPIHHVKMRRREKNGQSWWSHKATDPDTGEEYWCRGEQKQG
jgi:hypothetical protein